MELALFQPDIAGNVGTTLRLCACMDIRCHIIEPCGFPFGERALKRAGMDYLEVAAMQRHADWSHFEDYVNVHNRRIVLMTTKAAQSLYTAEFRSNDILLMGSEGAGVPANVHDRSDMRIKIPMKDGFRSLNVAVAAGIALSEALRQINEFPSGASA